MAKKNTSELYNLEAEQALLGAMLLDSNEADQILSELDTDSFYHDTHRAIYRGIKALRTEGIPLDPVTIAEHFRAASTLEQIGGATYISTLANSVPTAANARHYMQIIQEKAARREIVKASALIREQAEAGDMNKALEIMEKAKAEVAAIAEGRHISEYEPEIVCVADIEPEEVRWLWKPYIPSRKMSILAGPPGVGKTFLSLALVTAITTGKPLPDQDGKSTIYPKPGNVLLLGNEDDIADTVRPRLDAMGADIHRVFRVEAKKNIRTRKRQAISLLDVDILRASIQKYEARLVVIDPVQAFIGGNVDMNNRQHISLVLTDIGELAKECDTAFLLLMHLNKGARDRTLDKVTGSGEFTSKVRSVLMVGRDPQNPNLRVMAQEKMSVAKEGASVLFSLDGGMFTWAGTTTVTATEMLQPDMIHEERRSKLGEAMDWLKDQLSDGSKYNGEELLRDGENADIARKTLRRAAQELGVVIERERGARGRWFWSLPGDTQNTLTL